MSDIVLGQRFDLLTVLEEAPRRNDRRELENTPSGEPDRKDAP